MTLITLLVDYKNYFGSKYDAVPYRSGMDKKLLSHSFKNFGIDVRFMPFPEVNFSDDWKGKIVLYTSSEDIGYHYKSYIEDIVYGLEHAGALLIPNYNHLRANNNKVFMEILREQMAGINTGLQSKYFGTLDEALAAVEKKQIQFPCVVKLAEGACSTGVKKAENIDELVNVVKTMCSTKSFLLDIKDSLRPYKHKGYIKESKYRHKFIVQPMIEGLAYDWKLLIYGNNVFHFKRHVRKNDFRASGSHNNYTYGFESGVQKEVLDYAYNIYKKLNVPMLSIDIAYDGKEFYMLEFQSVYFGSVGFVSSKNYYSFENNEWVLKQKEGTYEDLFAWSINDYMEKNKLK